MNVISERQAAVQRVFIGIPIDENSQETINSSLEPIKRLDLNVRWVPEKNRHLTLAFPGEQPVSVVENLVQQFDQTYQSERRFQYCMSTLTRFPDPEGRIVAIVDDPIPPMLRLFQITGDLLKTNNIDFDRREFRPHITLGRIKQAKQVKISLARQLALPLNVDRVVLYQSTFTESGPVYTKLKQTLLDGCAQGL
jgi:2'-5' RNA ligase